MLKIEDYSALLFDLDGTLVDTMPLHYRAYAQVFAERGLTLTEPAFMRRYWGVALISDWHVGSTVTWELDKGVTIADERQVVLVSDPPRRLSYTWHTLTPEFLAAYGGIS